VTDERGQALSFEGITAAIILLAAVGFALQVTAVTPLSPSTSSQHVENQIQASAEGALDSAYEHGALQEAVLYWNTTEDGGFHGTGAETLHYQGSPPDGLAISETLNRTFGERSIAYNVRIQYHTEDGMSTQQLIEQGRPSDHAVSASRTLVLFEDDRLVEADGSRSDVALGDLAGDLNAEFYASDTDDTSVYNVIHVEVVAWRI